MLKKLKAAIRSWEASAGDAILGISTLGSLKGGYPEHAGVHHDSFWYESKSYYLNWLYLRPLQLRSDDVVYDIGCGAGRLLFVAGLFGVARCVGLELSQHLSELAKSNVSSLRLPHPPTEIHHMDASMQNYSDGSVFLFCNPFGPKTLESVLDRIHQSLHVRPRKIRVMYIHPEEGHRELFERIEWLKFTGERSFPGARGVPAVYFEAGQAA